MALTLWIREKDQPLVHSLIDDFSFTYYCEFGVSRAADSSEETIMSGTTDKTGIISRLKKEFVVGKVRYWEYEGSKQRIPFVRINNSIKVYEHGLLLCPLDGHSIKFRGGKTIDQLTNFDRVELLSAIGQDFVKKVFVTYYTDALVPKPHDFERRFLLYSDASHLHEGKVVGFF